MAGSEHDAIRRATREWLLRVAAETGLTLSRLAKDAGVSPATLYRTANDPEHRHVLSTKTIALISRRTGIAPPKGFDLAGEGRDVALPEAERFNAGAADERARRFVQEADGEVEAWVLRTRALELAGYLPGDVVLLDRHAQPGAGDVVCAEAYSFARGRTEPVWRLYEPPYLVAATADRELLKPLRDDTAKIKGVVVALYRPRLAAA